MTLLAQAADAAHMHMPAHACPLRALTPAPRSPGHPERVEESHAGEAAV